MKRLSCSKKQVNWGAVWAGIIALSFVLRIYILMDPTREPVYQLLYSLLYVAVGTVAVQSADFRANRGFLLLALCFCWAIFSCALHTYEEREAMQLCAYLLAMVFSFFVCYPLAFVLPEERMRRAFHAVSIGYLALIAAFCCVGVYVGISGTAIESLAGPSYVSAAMSGGRLSIFCYPTITATFCCLGLLVGLYLLVSARRVAGRILCAGAMLLAYAALALTDTRTSGVFFSVCFGGFCYLIASVRLPMRKRFARFAVSALIAAVALLACYGGQRLIYKAVTTVRQTAVRAMPQEPAPARKTVALLAAAREPRREAAQEQTGEPAGTDADEGSGARSLFENLGTFQGRTYAWEGAIRALISRPELLLTGSSPLFVMNAVEPYIERLYGGVPFVHLHSIFFQTLVAYGLPGLLLFGALAAYILFHALRVFFCKTGCTLAERTLPLLLFFCMAVDLLETFLSFTDVTKHSSPWFFLAGGYVVYLSTTRIGKRAAKNEPSASD